MAWARQGMGNALSDNQSTFVTAAKAGADEAGQKIDDTFSTGSGSMFGLLAPAQTAIVAAIDAVLNASRWVRSIAEGWALGSFFTELARPAYLPFVHEVASLNPTDVPDPATNAQMVTKGVFGHDQASADAARNNLSVDHFDRLIELAYTQPGISELLTLFQRGLLNGDDVAHALTRLGYETKVAGVIPNLAQQLLAAPDLALAVLRGHLQHDDAAAIAAKQGIDGNDFDTLIANTGEPPGLMELLEAYRRGFIDESNDDPNNPGLVQGILQSRVRNQWIPTVEKLGYSPMSTADAVRAVVEDYMTPADGRVVAKHNGLEDGAFDVLVEAWGRPLSRTEMASLVHRGLASKDQFIQAMRESDLKNHSNASGADYLELSFRSADRLIPERQIVTAIRYGALDLPTGSQMLLELGYSADSAKILLKLGLKEQNNSSHELTRAQIITLYKDHVLRRADAEKHLTTLGYSQQDANYLLQAIDYQAQVATLKQETSTIRVEYLAGNVDAVGAEHQLTQAGVDAAQARHLIDVWDKERKRATRTLSPAQIVKGVKNGVIAEHDGEQLLIALGYSAENAVTLLAIAGALQSPPITAPHA
jgi:hypothetical protein